MPDEAIPRIALRVPDEAAKALGVSSDFFDEHVRPELRLIRRGRLVFVAVRELERWAESESAGTLECARQSDRYSTRQEMGGQPWKAPAPATGGKSHGT